MGEDPKEVPAAESTADPAAQPLRDPDFERIYETYVPLLRKIATRQLGIPREDAELLVHDIFATYLTHRDQVYELYPYLIGSICNAARHYWGKNDAEQALSCGSVPCVATPDQVTLDAVARSRELSIALGRLDANCRETLYRFYMGRESVGSIAESRATTKDAIVQLIIDGRRRVHAEVRSIREASSP